MEAICPSETLVDFQQNTWRYISEDHHRCENPKSYINKEILRFEFLQRNEFKFLHQIAFLSLSKIGNISWVGSKSNQSE
jgi:hypothetical protein